MFSKTFSTLKAVAFLAFSALSFLACERKIDYDLSEIPTDFTPLAKPEAGKGFQMHLPAFPVPAQFEREIYVRLPLGNTESVFAKGFESKMRPGSHHLILYDFKNETDPAMPEIGVIRDQNTANGTLNLFSQSVFETPLFQSPNADFRLDLPDGYAFEIPANTTYDMNVHYFNKSDQTRFGEVYANIYTTPENEVKQLLKVEYLEPDTFAVPPNRTSIDTSDFMMEAPRKFITIISHYHKRGRQFDVQIVGGPRNGELIYSSQDYEHPVVQNFADGGLLLQKGEGLRTIVTYENETNRTIPFGVTSEDEMNILITFSHEM